MMSLVKMLPFLCKFGFDCGNLGTPLDMCKTDADCSGTLKCAIENKGYSQCIDCTAATFATQCTYMSESFLPHAEETCGIKHCTGRCPGHNDTECDKPESCVVEDDGNYAQCIDCTNATSFNEKCIYWSPNIRSAAETKCSLNCSLAPPSPSPGPGPTGKCHNNTECSAPAQCIEEEDHNWAQCIDCTNETTYAHDCKFWSDNIRAAANAKCGLKCEADAGGYCHGDDLTCPKPQSCVIQADGNYAECIDCTDEKSFDAACKFWSDQIRAAAEKQCGFKCPM